MLPFRIEEHLWDTLSCTLNSEHSYWGMLLRVGRLNLLRHLYYKRGRISRSLNTYCN